jgi:hypothetical protein
MDRLCCSCDEKLTLEELTLDREVRIAKKRKDLFKIQKDLRDRQSAWLKSLHEENDGTVAGLVVLQSNAMAQAIALVKMTSGTIEPPSKSNAKKSVSKGALGIHQEEKPVGGRTTHASLERAAHAVDDGSMAYERSCEQEEKKLAKSRLEQFKKVEKLQRKNAFAPGNGGFTGHNAV